MEENKNPEIPALDISSLAQGLPPPPHLEQRVVATLQTRRLVSRQPARGGVRWWVAIAAAVVLFAAGFGLGQLRGSASPHTTFTFVLLLHEGPGWREAASPREEVQRVAEYKAWAGRLRKKGIQIDGTELGDQVEILSASVAASGFSQDGVGKIGGFFAIHAGNLQDAIAIARTCPHLSHGGQIELRPIEGT